MPPKPLIHLVDDDDAIRHSASFMLRHAGFRVKTYPDGISFLQDVKTAESGCILLDVQMPVMDGLAVQSELTKRGIDMPVVILTGHGDVAMAVQAMKAGASDFVEKPYEKSVLIGAIHNAFDKMQNKTGLEQLSQEARVRLAILTPREMDVLAGLVQGMTNKAIGQAFGISPRTVEIHRANLMDKLKVESLSEALRLAFSAGMGVDSE